MNGVGDLMLSSAAKLAAIGADFLICPDNTVHAAFDYVAARSPKPWLHIAEVVAEEAAERGFERLGLTGTRWLVESDVYPQMLSRRRLECVRPSAAERAEIHRIIMDELVFGVFEGRRDRVFPAGVLAHEARRLRCGRSRLYRNSVDHERREFAAAHTRFDAPARVGGGAPRVVGG
jgi:aspartate/glutamate racemase